MSTKSEIIAQIKATSMKDKIDGIIERADQVLQSNNSLSLELAQEANKLAQQEIYTERIADSLKLMALNYQYLTNYTDAMKFAIEAREIYKVIDNKRGEAACLNILGAVYNFLGDLNKRLESNLECLELRTAIKDEKAQLSSLNNIGDTYLSMGDYENALKYFNHCLTFSNIEDSINAIVNCNIAEVYFYQGKYDLALQYNATGLKYALASDYYQIIVAAYVLESQIHLKHNRAEEAITELRKAVEVFNSRELKEQEFHVYELFSQAYSQLNNWEKAYYYLNKYSQLRNSIMHENSAQKMNKIEFDYRYKSITTEAEEIKEKNELLTRAFGQIEQQSNEIRAKNKAITDSIHYAKRIQYALLPYEDKVKEYLQDYFIYYQPKDIVSGDFYWVEKVGDCVIFSVIDCTGHGVPGAFVSLIANNALNKVVLEKQITEPAAIINEMNTTVLELFKNSDETIRDGMDMGICSFNTKDKSLQFAGAFNSLYVYSNSILKEIKGNRESVGASIYGHEKKFINHIVDVNKGDVVYLSSDGFPDQFGGEKGKKLKWKGFKELLQFIGNKPIENQFIDVKSFFDHWKKDVEQLDDVCLIGVRI